MIVFISVDLPAPLSPTSATALPASTENVTPRKASIAPKVLRTSMSSSRLIGASPLAVHAVEPDGEDQDRAYGDLLVEGPDGHQVQPVLQHPHDECADQRADDAAAAAEQFVPPRMVAVIAVSS